MKGLIITIIILALIGLFIYKYITRQVKVNTENTKQDLEKDINKLPNHLYYRISQASSTIQFSVEENKSNGLHLVVGTNTQIYGDLTIDQENNELSVASNTITIDARTFKTDSKDRDGSINRLVLKTTTSGNEFITFQLDPILNLPNLENEKEITINASGTLTISKISKEINFEVRLTKNGDNLNITFQTEVSRKDFNIKLPGFPGTTVSDTVKIEAKIIAEQL